MEKNHIHLVRFFLIAPALATLFSDIQAMKRKPDAQPSSSSSSSSSSSLDQKRRKISHSDEKSEDVVMETKQSPQTIEDAIEAIPFIWEASFPDNTKRTIYFDPQKGVSIENKQNGSNVEHQEICVVAYENFKENDDIVVYACNHVIRADSYDSMKIHGTAVCPLCRKPDNVTRTTIQKIISSPEQLSDLFQLIQNTQEKERLLSVAFNRLNINMTSMRLNAYRTFFEKCLAKAPFLTGELISIARNEYQKKGYDFSLFIEHVGIEKIQVFLDNLPSTLHQQEKIDIFTSLIPSLIDKKEDADESEDTRVIILENLLKKMGSLDDETEGFADKIHSAFYQELEKIKIPCHKALELLLQYRLAIKNERDPKNNTLFLFLSSAAKKYIYSGIHSAIDMSLNQRVTTQKRFDNIKECIILLIKFGCNPYIKIDYALHDAFLQKKVLADKNISSHFIAIPYTSMGDWLTAAPRSFIDIFTDETSQKYSLKNRFFTHNTTQEFRAEIITIFNKTPLNQNYAIESGNSTWCTIQ